MEQKDSRLQNTETRIHHQGQERVHNQGQDKSQQTAGVSFIVRKAEKLTTALYMVTDIISEKEPMKWKARETGVELLSDIMVMSSSGSSERMTVLRDVAKKIERVVSFLDVAQGTRMMSEMNASVLKKEYTALKDAVMSEWQRTYDNSKHLFAESFFEVVPEMGETTLPRKEESVSLIYAPHKPHADHDQNFSRPISAPTVHQGHQGTPKTTVTPESVQFPKVTHVAPSLNSADNTTKHHTEALRQNVFTPALPKPATRDGGATFIPRAKVSPTGVIERPRQDVGRDDRRKIILALIKQKPALTVKDITKSIPGVSEKTIQRELFAMVTDGVLTKKGDRRWSTYSLAV
jgi:hypothetical protein